MNMRSLTDDDLCTAALILTGSMNVQKYSQEQFDDLCDTVVELEIAAQRADHLWIAEALDAALCVASDGYLRKGQV